ncbi:hypothetical protein HanPSC8_Chr02g0075991 [Helianthus annuus]|nr:hypothetical protein HanPSC8_Chr02g0075991 [Helianthus annuus]
MRNIRRLKIARRTHNLNGIKFDFFRFINGNPSNRMARNIEMVRTTRPVPIRVIMTNIINIIFNKILDTVNPHPWIVSQSCN